MSTVMDMDERYNPFTGKRVVPGLDDAIPVAAALGLEPPRFCEQCGRRMIVQVSPDGWWAKCSRHGVIDSAELERR
ncbi:biotin synthase auxiliary protein BsaP [Nocardia sp. R7R-8]|uniref:biotin synthase auxiliary protein BsaP n=1 Tax=Nocardia sp. R7R-8 TaxID=3459304 RepID=UPI00403E2450